MAAAAVPGIDAARMQELLTSLSVFGRPVGGTFASGVSRVGYSDADIAGRRFVVSLMEAAGARVREYSFKIICRVF